MEKKKTYYSGCEPLGTNKELSNEFTLAEQAEAAVAKARKSAGNSTKPNSTLADNRTEKTITKRA